MPALASDLRRQLEGVCVQARDVAEAAARSALQKRAVDAAKPFPHMDADERQLRNRLRARGRQAGDVRRDNDTQAIDQITQELAYEYWHRMLFARFLAENHLLMHPDGVAVSLEECDELAAQAKAGTLTLTRCTFEGNMVGGYGGAVATVTAVIENCTFVNNTAVGDISGDFGGAVTCDSGTIENSVFVNNYADAVYGRGGAISCGNATVRNCLIDGNSANSGGGIYSDGTLLLQNCTLTENSAYSGSMYVGFAGGIFMTGSNNSLQLQSTIVSGNYDDNYPDIEAKYVQASHSAIGSNLGITNFTDQGGNLPFGANLNLDGNFIPTLNSPCINAGANPANLATDIRGAGFPRVAGSAADIGAFENESVPETILSVQINDGSAQRSRVTSLTITFDRSLSLPSNPADAFQLVRQSDNMNVALNANVSGATVTLSFPTGEYGSLPDGRYTLTAFAALINNGNFDGNGDLTPGDDYILASAPSPEAPTNIFRLFGDADGNGTVNAADFLAFRLAFLQSSTIFDFDGSGTVDAGDFLQFRLRFLQMI